LYIHRLTQLADGRLFGTAQAYSGRFLFDPETGEATPLGNGGPSIYALTAYGDDLYWSGYPSGPVDVFDPEQPWTVLKGGPPGEEPPEITDEDSNPRRVIGELHSKTRVKKMFSSAFGADGRIYFGGAGIRDYAGGSLAWLDPETDEFDGIWRPFSAYRIYWLASAVDGRYIVASTKTAVDELNENLVPESAKLFVWDTETLEIVREVVPVSGAAKAGPLLEVAPGRLLGIAEDPEVEGGGLLYGVEVESGEVLFTKELPASLQFAWGGGTRQWDYALGPDGNIYTYLGNVLVRIRPIDASVEVLGKILTPGKMCFVGDDLYLAGAEPVRRLPGIAAERE
ncbi:MAG TPA: hypothetical protein QGH10_01870, partial [Armatimonadota bacterium]|nr:hypothetical protein [Armatimonadota bacterium]